MSARAAESGPWLYDSWPHPKAPEPVDERLVELIRSGLVEHAPDLPPVEVAEWLDDAAKALAVNVWAWLAEGDET